MILLALDTSSKAASCALLRDGALAGEFFVNVALTHSQTMMPMVEALLLGTGIAVGDIDAFAVSTGPGSFTGLRIGIAAVKGLAVATGKPCVPVSTLEALAANLPQFRGVIVPVMDARRAQVYTARFRWTDSGPERLTEDTALSLDTLREQLAAIDEPVLLVGDGVALCMEHLGDLPRVAAAPENVRHQRAGSVAAVAARLLARGGTVSAGALLPQYLRLPQAERERLARLER